MDGLRELRDDLGNSRNSDQRRLAQRRDQSDVASDPSNLVLRDTHLCESVAARGMGAGAAKAANIAGWRRQGRPQKCRFPVVIMEERQAG